MAKLATTIRDCIPCGKENAISRTVLENTTGFSDRKNRDLISQSNMKSDKPPICNIGNGYFIATADDRDAVTEYCNKETSRARQIEKKVWRLRKWLENTDKNQLHMEI